jgi:TRAP-type mannitol/chloroaromatic compound transport system permease small subunit
LAANESSGQDPIDDVPTAGDPGGDHDDYISLRERLLASEQHYARSYDKWLLTLSGGALALSMVLCKDVVVGTPQGTGWLLASWILFAAAILSTLACILLSHSAHEKDVELLDHLYGKHEVDWQTQVHEKQGEQWGRKAIAWLNGMSLMFFTFGLCLLAYFASQNMVKNGEGNVEPEQTTGDFIAAEGSHHWKTGK